VSSCRIRRFASNAIQVVLHLNRTDRRRYVHEVIRVGRYNGAHDRYETETVFANARRRPRPEGVDDTTASEN
jgi:hypothetical protein